MVGGAGLTAYVLYLNRPPVETQPPVFEPPSVRVQSVAFETVSLTVASQGTVQPRTTSQLVPEISGVVTEVAPSFAVGGFFDAGDVLLQIDPYDYQQAIITARSQRAQAQLRLAQEEAEAEVARREWAELGRGDPNALTLRQPQLEEARAAVAAAEAALDRARRDIDRAAIRAPYAGRVQSKDVDIGQFVTKGTPVARIYAVDSAEIRLPLPDQQLAYLDVALSYRGGGQQTGPSVTLSANFAGRQHTWQGRIVRTESEIDPVSRMVHLVAEVRDPYAPGSDPSRPPLAVGMFVEAEIEGRTVRDIVVLPRAALRGRDQVLVVDESSRLHYRQVEILRSTSDEVLIRGGLAEGDVVCVSPLDTVTDGMAVRVLDADVRMARATAAAGMTGDIRALTASDTPAPAPDTTRESDVTSPTAGNVDIDPTLSREDQIAAIRRQLERLGSTPAAATPSPSPRAEPNAPAPAPAAPAPEPDARPATIASPTRTVAVAPFANVSRNPVDAWISADLTTALRTVLEETGALSIVALTAADEATAIETAEARNARWLVGGGYQHVGDLLRITARVLEVTSGTLVGTVKVDGRLGELETLTREMVAAVGATFVDDDAASGRSAERNPIRRADPADRLGVAVLPFANVSRNPTDAGLGGDMADAMAGGLRQLDGVSVVTLDAEDEGAALDAATARSAAWLISGGYQHVGGQLRITARLLDVATGELVQTVKVDGALDELPDLLAEVVSSLRSALDARTAKGVGDRMSVTGEELPA